MNAMQKTSTTQQKDGGGGGDDQQQMKVPKLKLKLSKPFEKPDESEQSSTESDSGSDNENDDEENDTAMMSGMSTEMNSNDLDQHHQALAFNHQSDDQQQQQQHEQHPYDANNSFLDASNRFAAENANESGLSAKNTSTESLNDQITQHTDVQYPAHFENDTSTQMPSDQLLPLEQHELHPDDESATSNADITAQTDLAADTNNVASLHVRTVFFSKPTAVKLCIFKSNNFISKISFDRFRTRTIQHSNQVSQVQWHNPIMARWMVNRMHKSMEMAKRSRRQLVR